MTDKTEAPELKPCPLCGGADAFAEQADQASSYVVCNDCGTRGPECCPETDTDLELEEANEWGPGECAARRTWNTRTDACAEVKPLVWVQESDFHCHEIFVAKTFFGQYSAFDPVELNAGFYIELEDCALDVSEGPYADMEEAKRACQSDVNTKMEGITTRPASEVHQEGYEAGQADITDKLPWRMRDVQRGLILFRTSNNAHGYTNYSAKPEVIDELPQAARDELAAIMTNMAIGYSRENVKRNGVIQQWIKEAEAAGYAQAREDAATRADQRAESWRFIGRGGIAEDYEDFASRLRALNKEAGE